MEKVSVILGLYNVSYFLNKKRLSCILNQTYPNLEIILVNDGSTDNTLEICEELEKADKRIRIVNKENGGLGSARNAGLDIATGTYVWFYDVDDEADLTLVEKNVHWIRQYKADLIIFGYWCITPHLNLTENVCFKERFINDNDKLKSIFVDEVLLVPNGNGFAWNKFYRKSFIDESCARFGNQLIQQDEIFNLRLYPKLKHVYISPEQCYHYFIYDKGNTRSRYIKERYDIYLSIFNCFIDFSKEWNLQDNRFENYIYRRFYSGIENVILFNTFHPNSCLSFKEKKNTIYTVLHLKESRDCFSYIKKNVRLGFEEKLYLRAFVSCSFYKILFIKYTFSYLRRMKKILKVK